MYDSIFPTVTRAARAKHLKRSAAGIVDLMAPCWSYREPSFKIEIQASRNQSHKTQNREITVTPFELRHEFEIHAVDSGDGGYYDKDRAPGHEPFHRYVQLIRS